MISHEQIDIQYQRFAFYISIDGRRHLTAIVFSLSLQKRIKLNLKFFYHFFFVSSNRYQLMWRTMCMSAWKKDSQPLHENVGSSPSSASSLNTDKKCIFFVWYIFCCFCSPFVLTQKDLNGKLLPSKRQRFKSTDFNRMIIN